MAGTAAARRVITLALALVAIGLAVASPAHAADLTFSPVADTYVDGATATTNYGTAQQVQVDASPAQQALWRFDVTGLGGRPVIAAKLRLWVANGSGAGGELH